MTPLIDYINDNFGGNKAAFARSIGIERQQLENMLKAKKPVLIENKKIYQELPYTIKNVPLCNGKP